MSQHPTRQTHKGTARPTVPEEEISDQRANILAVVGTLYGIATSGVLLRVWVRLRMPKAFGLDDWLMCIAGILNTSTLVCICRPVAAGYDLSLRKPDSCYSRDVFVKIGVFNSSVNIATDLLFATLPIPILWGLQINLKKKIGLTIVLSLGYFAAATAIYKTPIQYHFFDQSDNTGKGAWYYVWQIVEMDVGILAACLPTLKPLFNNLFETAKTITSGRPTTHHTSRDWSQTDPQGYSLSQFRGERGYQAHVTSGQTPSNSNSIVKEGQGHIYWDNDDYASDEQPLHS
ncbi:hypothetical protein Q7P37_006690 [Cladosporium fusiforme]